MSAKKKPAPKKMSKKSMRATKGGDAAAPQMLTNLQQMQHDTAKAVVANIRA